MLRGMGVDARLSDYLRDVDHMSHEDVLAVEAKKIGTRRQVETFLSVAERNNGSLRIARLEVWGGRMAVVYEPETANPECPQKRGKSTVRSMRN